MNSKDATFAIYRDPKEVKIAIHSFLKLGFDKSEVRAFQVHPDGAKDFSQVTKYQFKNSAMVGSVLGFFCAAGFAMLTKEDLLAGGRWVLVFFGILLGCLVGAAGGALIGIGIPDPAGKRYGQYLQSGGILLSVHSESPKQVRQAQEVLSATGGHDIHLVDEIETWDKAHLERIDLEKWDSPADANL